MIRFFLRSKIHRATVTAANLASEGSVIVDRFLMNAAGLLPYEKVEVSNVTRGNRFETYVREGDEGKGEIIVNGAAAHLAAKGDRVNIACYCLLHDGQTLDHKPKLVMVDEKNVVTALREGTVS